jgi:hypothetical protein
MRKPLLDVSIVCLHAKSRVLNSFAALIGLPFFFSSPMTSKAFPGPQGAITPVAGPLIPQHASVNGMSPAVVGVVRRKRGPAGRETTHPLTINFPPRPLVKLEEPSGTTAG